MPKQLIYDLDFTDLSKILESWGEASYRVNQIWQGIYHHYWVNETDFSTLSIHLRQKLFNFFSFSHLEPIEVLNSTDGETQKTLFHLPDKSPVETVRMRYEKRRTLCISTQSGCAMGCVFCATGQMGFYRNLSSGEIVEQVLYFARLLRKRNERVTNIVLMGMGEPFHNYENVMAAIDRLNDPRGMNLGARRFTISTVGLVPGIKRLAEENRQVNLAVSLHATDNELRSSLLPVNKKYPIEILIAALREYTAQTRRRVTIEWALIQGKNDLPEQAHKLAALLDGILVHVNVIPLNPTAGYSGLATTNKQSLAFKAILESHSIPCTVRLRRGIDIQAGCGQLASKS
jgi:23S rRNA (adenine2503-C2)-methyltransferase